MKDLIYMVFITIFAGLLGAAYIIYCKKISRDLLDMARFKKINFDHGDNWPGIFLEIGSRSGHDTFTYADLEKEILMKKQKDNKEAVMSTAGTK